MKISIAAGGSGGHVFPALAVAENLKDQGHELTFFTTRGIMYQRIKNREFNLIPVSACGLNTESPVLFIRSFCLIVKSIFESFGALMRTKPDVVAGFGGYGSFSTVFAAAAMGIPTMIHEQNVFPGRANRFLSKIVKRVAISFEQTKGYLNRNAELTGCPGHYGKPSLSRYEILEELGLRADLPVILVLGGSQGSQKINEVFCVSALELKKTTKFQVIHVSGQKDFGKIKERYNKSGVSCFVCDFLDEIEKAYKAADCVVSRAGAVTICELSFFGLPSIIIPYPFAGGHQRENAEVLKDSGLAKVIEEKDLDAKILSGFIKEAINKKDIEKKNDIVFYDADARITKLILELKK